MSEGGEPSAPATPGLLLLSYTTPRDAALASDVPADQITLTINPAYRYAGSLSDCEQRERFSQDTIKDFLSYASGCMMGRYSLDQPGLILADSRDSQAEQLTAYEEKVGKTLGEVQFKPDPDGIISVLDGEWFEDDIVARSREFLRVCFPASSLNTDLAFIETALGKDLRKYFCSDFYKDHLQTYKNARSTGWCRAPLAHQGAASPA